MWYTEPRLRCTVLPLQQLSKETE